LRELPLSVAQRFLCAHQVIDVEVHAIPPNNRAVGAAHCGGMRLNPSIHAIEPPLAMPDHVRLARDQAFGEQRSHDLQVVRVDRRGEYGGQPRAIGLIL
jgi:hypothetical protein